VRTVLDNFQRAFECAARWDPHAFKVRELWINDGSGGPGKQHFRSVRILSLWFDDLSKPVIGASGEMMLSDCDAGCQVKTADLPRRPEPLELLEYPRKTVWQIATVKEHEGLYTIGLNRARAPKQ
jgi:hypothetical protein